MYLSYNIQILFIYVPIRISHKIITNTTAGKYRDHKVFDNEYTYVDPWFLTYNVSHFIHVTFKHLEKCKIWISQTPKFLFDISCQFSTIKHHIFNINMFELDYNKRKHILYYAWNHKQIKPTALKFTSRKTVWDNFHSSEKNVCPF